MNCFNMLTLMLFWCSSMSMDKHYASAILKEDAVIYKQLGVILQRSKTIAIDTDYSMVSVFMKLNIPDYRFQCGNNTFGAELNSLLHKEIKRNIDMFSSLTEVRRRKRNLWGAIGSTILSTAFSAFGDVYLYKKVKGLQTKFLKFSQKVEEFEQNQLKFDGEIISIMRNMADVVNSLNCNSREQQQKLHLNKVLDTLNTMFASLNTGSLEAPLNAKLISPSEIKDILRDHSELSTTLFSTDNVMYFYKSVNTLMADVEYVQGQNLLAVHFLLSVPWLTQNNTFVSYDVRQTGFRSKERCYEVQLPGTVIRTDYNTFKALSDIQCTDRDPRMSLCYSQPALHLPLVLCLTNYSACDFTNIPCKSVKNYIFDRTGILIHHEGEIQVLNRKSPRPFIERITPPKNNIIFIQWAEAKLVQVGNHNFYSPNFISTYLDITPVNTSHVNKIIETKVNDLEESLPIAADTHMQKSHGLILSIIIGVVTFVFLAVGILWLKLKCSPCPKGCHSNCIERGVRVLKLDEDVEESPGTSTENQEYMRPLRS